MVPVESTAPSTQPELCSRSFVPEEVDALLRDLVAVHVEEQQRIPYGTVREMVSELGLNPDGLDGAIGRLAETRRPNEEGRRIADWSVVLLSALAVCIAAWWLWLPSAALSQARSPAAAPAAAVAAPPRKAKAARHPAPALASAGQLRELRQQSVLLGQADDFRLVVHNPFRRGVKRLLVRIDSAALGRRFDQRYWFTPAVAVDPYESAGIRVPHELPETPSIHSWKIESAEFEGQRSRL